MTTAQTVKAQDFSSYTTDNNRFNWTARKMEILVESLTPGATVAVEVDKMTGHTVIGRLIGVLDGIPGRGSRVTIETDLRDGSTQRTNYLLSNVGTSILILAGDESRPGGGAKWRALDLWRKRMVWSGRYYAPRES